MRALAQFIMRGRTQAAVVALVGYWVFLLTPATVALVTLRRGLGNGIQVLLWGVLPAIVLLALHEQGALLAINAAVAVFIAAMVLRYSASWRHTFMALVACNTLAALLVVVLVPALVSQLIKAVTAFFQQFQLQTDQALSLPTPDVVLVLGLLATMASLTGVLALLLARWWQALLYNPGGFAAEFRALRLGPIEASLCILAAAYCYSQAGSYSIWMATFTLPLLFAGIALIHALVARRGLGLSWLVAFYIALVVLLQPMVVLLVLVAFIDTWLNFRGRIAPKA